MIMNEDDKMDIRNLLIFPLINFIEIDPKLH